MNCALKTWKKYTGANRTPCWLHHLTFTNSRVKTLQLLLGGGFGLSRSKN